MNRVLLTGSTGFLGKKIFEVLTAHEYDVISFQDDLKKDISEESVDIVIHAAAFVNLSRDFFVGKECFEVNTIGTMNLLKSFINNSPRFFLYISTEEVYGNGSIPFHEDQCPDPPSPYAISKLAGEHLVSWYGREYSIPIAILRFGTFYGPDQPKHRYFAQVILQALNNQPILCNSGEKKRDYIYIDDAVDLIFKIIQTKATGIFNGTGGKSYRLIDVITIIKSLTHSQSEIKIGDIPERLTERDEWLSDISKAKRILNWEPKVDLEEGLRRTILWFQKNY
ncbi:MAG: NAD(P)-dependent oxidoreductase [Patescibacteria group bacterium]|nr:NAD(P)-dependent oxidoreductase [Patescibacteria group bacterium]